MLIRKIVEIDEEKCTGCGLCIPACKEGAIQIVDGKAKLVSDKYCDGLGDCLGHCPEGAIKIIEREADEFNEEAVQERLQELEDEEGCSAAGCPGSDPITFSEEISEKERVQKSPVEDIKPQLKQWPVQINLVPVDATYFEDASLLICADCVPFAYPALHSDLMKGKVVLIGCPKLDNAEHYAAKLAEIFKINSIKDITVARMEVACCSILEKIVDTALEKAGKKDAVPLNKIIISIKGKKKQNTA